MGHLNMRRQGIKSTKEKPHDTDLEDNIKTNVVFCKTVDPSTTKERKATHICADGSPPLQVGGENTFVSCMCIIVTPYYLQL